MKICILGIESGPVYEKACMTTCIVNFLEFSGYYSYLLSALMLD